MTDSVVDKMSSFSASVRRAETKNAQLRRVLKVDRFVEDIVTGWDKNNHLTHAPGRAVCRVSIRVPVFVGRVLLFISSRAK